MTATKRILFAGYAPVHFLCFRPVYERLRAMPGVEVWLSGGFRHKVPGAEPRHELAGFYDPFGVDMSRVAHMDALRDEHFDVVVCAHTSDVYFPRSYGRSVQIFHGVSFKGFAVREKVLKYDYACVPGRYHAERFDSQEIMGAGATQFLLTGFPKLDRLVAGAFDRSAFLSGIGLDPELPTILYAPTGGKHNSLDDMGEELIASIAAEERWNLLVKPHDHPKKAVNWFEHLAPWENERLRIVRDYDIVPYLRGSDLLLTDASSVSMEYTLLDRPVVFIDVPKLLANVVKRGGALDLETYGRKIGTLASGTSDVVPTIAAALADPEQCGELRRRAAGHVFHAPGEATANVTGVVLHAAGLADELPAGVERLSSSRSGV